MTEEDGGVAENMIIDVEKSPAERNGCFPRSCLDCFWIAVVLVATSFIVFPNNLILPPTFWFGAWEVIEISDVRKPFDMEFKESGDSDTSVAIRVSGHIEGNAHW